MGIVPVDIQCDCVVSQSATGGFANSVSQKSPALQALFDLDDLDFERRCLQNLGIRLFYLVCDLSKIVSLAFH
jgi:hypothetical protein